MRGTRGSTTERRRHRETGYRAAIILILSYSLQFGADLTNSQIKFLQDLDAMNKTMAAINARISERERLISPHYTSESLAWNILPWAIAGSVCAGLITGLIVSGIKNGTNASTWETPKFDLPSGLGVLGACGLGCGITFTIWIGSEQSAQKEIRAPIRKMAEESDATQIKYDALTEDGITNTSKYFDMDDPGQLWEAASFLLKAKEDIGNGIRTRSFSEPARAKFVRVAMKLCDYRQSNGQYLQALRTTSFVRTLANNEEIHDLEVYKKLHAALAKVQFSSYEEANDNFLPVSADRYTFANIVQLEAYIISLRVKVISVVENGQYILDYQRPNPENEYLPLSFLLMGYTAEQNKCPRISLVDGQWVTVIGIISGTTSYVNIAGGRNTVPKITIYAMK